MIEAIVFDMDGILFDTERLSVESWIEVAERLGLAVLHHIPADNRLKKSGKPGLLQMAFHRFMACG